MRKYAIPLLLLLAAGGTQAQTWKPLGPPGGDVRSLAADPSRPGRIFLGTVDGHIFGSGDSGAHWTLLGRVSERLDDVITAIVVDPRDSQVVFASAWTQDPSAGGGVFRSGDGGHSWRPAGLAGQAVRALVMAPSDPNILVAGTLGGVYRSRDASRSWERISPEHHEELRNLDSLAIDPHDPQTIYAGTFHLPWKTTDGGRTWHPIHAGMIDDSDVMSLLIDRSVPGRIYASACSGIYRSDNRAAQWKKIQGIPYTARRTYQIAQDPKHPASVYAATSEGLWKTSNAGMTWQRTTPPTWAVNTVVIAGGDPTRVLIGTEQLGVLSSDDGGEHFEDANAGFFHRQIVALALDRARPGRILAVLAHAPQPILATDDDGKSWKPLGPGLRSEQVLRVYASPEGWWASLAHGGLMRYDAQKKAWRRAGLVREEESMAATPARKSRSSVIRARIATRPLQQIVNDMAFSANRWYAATNAGLLMSADQGAVWELKPLGPLTTLPVNSVRVSPDGERLWVVSLRGMVVSTDGGKSWTWHDLPLKSGGAISLETDGEDKNILISRAHNGLYISRDAGSTWRQAGSGLPSTPVQDFVVAGKVFLASMSTGGLYVSSNTGRTWTRVPGTLADGFFPAVTAMSDTGVIFAASATDGLYTVQWPGLPTASAASIHPSQN
ncbi:MAG TPA: YCF48-related protein [Candidatus Dormibacteraeota bacterium]|nr:YCF48-related protein [Candidatus Dormibacteraeota bacterium]